MLNDSFRMTFMALHAGVDGSVVDVRVMVKEDPDSHKDSLPTSPARRRRISQTNRAAMIIRQLCLRHGMSSQTCAEGHSADQTRRPESHCQASGPCMAKSTRFSHGAANQFQSAQCSDIGQSRGSCGCYASAAYAGAGNGCFRNPILGIRGFQ